MMCSRCSTPVLRVPHASWKQQAGGLGGRLDYVTLRTLYPDLSVAKGLGRFLQRHPSSRSPIMDGGAVAEEGSSSSSSSSSSAAYACQCSWRSVSGWLQLTPRTTPELRWYCPGHRGASRVESKE